MAKYDSVQHLKSMEPLVASRLFDVKGKVAVVTGGSRGIGLMMCKTFVENGATVYVVSRKAAAVAEAVAALNGLSSCTGRAVALPADVGTEAACKALAAEVASKESKIDILVNNAGITWGSDFEEHPEAAWGKTYNLNVTAMFQLTRAFVPLLKEASNGNLDPSHVVNVSSTAGNMNSSSPLDNAPSYAASKAAANKVTQILASYLVKDHINVNCIAPAVFPSKMTFQYQLKTDELADFSASMHPVGRVGNETDMGGLLLFLSSRASAFVTGSIIRLDGGLTAIRSSM